MRLLGSDDSGLVGLIHTGRCCHGNAHGSEGNGGIVYCKGDHVESIFMQGNRLHGSLTDAVSRMHQLRILELPDNNLRGPIPPLPTSLEILDLGGNKNRQQEHGLTGHIPHWIGNLTGLKVLKLQLNKLNGTIPESVKLLRKLKILYAYNNHLEGHVLALDFKQYSYCGIGNGGPEAWREGKNRNRWCTPLPDAKGCDEEGGVCADGSCHPC